MLPPIMGSRNNSVSSLHSKRLSPHKFSAKKMESVKYGYDRTFEGPDYQIVKSRPFLIRNDDEMTVVKNRLTISPKKKVLSTISVDKVSKRKFEMGHVHEKRFEYIDHTSTILS